jgi:hypothetical protein
MTNKILLSIQRELHCLEAELSAMQRFALGVSYEIPDGSVVTRDERFLPHVENVKKILRQGNDTQLDVNVVFVDGFKSNLKYLVQNLMGKTYPGSKFEDSSDSLEVDYNVIRCKIKHADGSISTILMTITGDHRAGFQTISFQFT